MSPLVDQDSQRPWGYYTVLLDAPYCKVKEITVEPGHRLSYQSHTKRQEQWTVVTGNLTVIIDGREHTVYRGKSIHIPWGCKHRAWNKTDDIVQFIEVQTGTYFGEDDIIRYEDDYKRE